MVAENDSTIQSDYLLLARQLGLVKEKEKADPVRSDLLVNSWLTREAGWLLIFDNADDPALVRPYLPSSRTGGKVLLTSRAESFVDLGIRESFRVKTLDPQDAVDFLINRTDNADVQAAAELAAELGYLPLALEQAAAYIDTVGRGFGEYLKEYRRKGVAMFAKGKPSTGYPKTVATTWAMNFVAIRESWPASAELLTAAAFLPPELDSIPIILFTHGGSEMGDLLAQALNGADEEPLIFWELFEPLERYSLVERLPNAFKLHHLTRKIIIDSLSEEAQLAWPPRLDRAAIVSLKNSLSESFVLDMPEPIQPLFSFFRQSLLERLGQS